MMNPWDNVSNQRRIVSTSTIARILFTIPLLPNLVDESNHLGITMETLTSHKRAQSLFDQSERLTPNQIKRPPMRVEKHLGNMIVCKGLRVKINVVWKCIEFHWEPWRERMRVSIHTEEIWFVYFQIFTSKSLNFNILIWFRSYIFH